LTLFADALELYQQALRELGTLDNSSAAVLSSNIAAVLLKVDRPEEALEYATAATQVPVGPADSVQYKHDPSQKHHHYSIVV
jgi:tetratricopeptide (TPR) repeat protein